MKTDLDLLDSEIAQMFSQSYAADYRLLCKIFEFDEENGWGQQGFLSCAHYLNFRVGLEIGAAREKVRVARAIQSLPKISALLEKGAISYSTVRALTRIATPDNEDELIGFSKNATAMQVEKLVRACRHVERSEQAKLEDKRSFSAFFDDDGMLVIRGRLTAEEGSLLLKALDAQKMRGVDGLVQVAEKALSAETSEGKHRPGHHIVIHVGGEVDHVEARPGERISVSAETSERIACDASVQVGNGRSTRKISRTLRQALFDRDHTCRFPGCTNRLVDAHHACLPPHLPAFFAPIRRY